MNSFRTMGGLVARLTVGAALLALATAAQAAVEKGSAKVVAVQGGAEVFDRRHDLDAAEAGRESCAKARWSVRRASAADLDLGRNGSRFGSCPTRRWRSRR
jgi:predicted lipoprotein with Yx(FWY)xxD motif